MAEDMEGGSRTGEAVDPAGLTLLRRLVTLLLVVMIVGLISLVGLIVIRFARPPAPPVPAEITLPAGVGAQAVTFGRGWYAVATDDGRLLVYVAGRPDPVEEIALPVE